MLSCATPALERRAAGSLLSHSAPGAGLRGPARPAHPEPPGSPAHPPETRRRKPVTQPRPGRHGAPYVTSCPCGRRDLPRTRDREPAKLTGETSLSPWALLSLVTAAAPGFGPGLHSRQGSGDSCEGHGHLSPLHPPSRRPPPSLRNHCAARRDAAPREQAAPRRFNQCFQGGRSRGRHLPPGWVGEGQERLPWAVSPESAP